MKIWQKNNVATVEVDAFTVGNDRELDLYLAPFDVLGSIAHITMLQSIGLLTHEEWIVLKSELVSIYEKIQSGGFQLDESAEDIHSQVEWLLTQKLGDTGKKIHAARSRNDQVMVDIKLYLRSEIENIVIDIKQLFDLLQKQSEQYKDCLLPGYTHFQLAMPSSFGLWFGAYAESLVDDVTTLLAAWEITNKNPLGSAAGFGSGFPINRTMTTKLLGFGDLNYNVVYAQMTRGKTEKILSQAMANIGGTLTKLSMDACLFMNQNFDFISFPSELTTGSSIMPHKKNPDVFELIRAHGNRLQSIPNEITILLANLPSGYHRDFQLIKEIIFPAIKDLRNCLSMTQLMIANIQVKENLLQDEKYKYLFTVEEMNKLVLEGMPLRDAYRKIGMDVENNTFKTDGNVMHTHEGSMGNLHNESISRNMNEVLARFNFKEVNDALQNLLK